MVQVLVVRFDGTGGDDFRLAATESLRNCSMPMWSD